MRYDSEGVGLKYFSLNPHSLDFWASGEISNEPKTPKAGGCAGDGTLWTHQISFRTGHLSALPFQATKTFKNIVYQRLN